MSQRPEDVSKQEPTTSANPSVFDFLYQDSRRVGSLLAQFDLNGVLTSVTQSDTAGSQIEDERSYGGKLDILALKAEAGDKEREVSSAANSSSRTYDPLWRNSLALLTFLSHHRMLHRGLGESRLGQLVLISGSLAVYDVPILKQIFAEPSAFKKLIGEHGSSRNWEQTRGILKILTTLPLSVQAIMHSDGQQVWMPLLETHMEVSATSIFLKYGFRVRGEWNMLGLLDAVPDDPEEPENDELDVPDHVVTEVLKNLSVFSEKFGRPRNTYSVTPLLIFRRVESDL